MTSGEAMTRRWLVVVVVFLIGMMGPGGPTGLHAAAAAGKARESREIRSLRRLFEEPPREYGSAPLWVWNDQLTPRQVRETLRDLSGQAVRQVFVHPRPGLMTPYLGKEWFDLWRVALDEASRLDMNVWIYDENSYPSGFAGGLVPDAMPESRGMGLVVKEVGVVPAWDSDTVAVHRLEGLDTRDISDAVRAGRGVGEAAACLVARKVWAENTPWHGGRSYVNLLTRGVTDKFLELTLGAYDREIAGEYGKRVPGVFTDEPNIRPAGGFPWCPDLPERFRERWGYDLVERIPALARETGDWRRVRHNYLTMIHELFVERWAKPYYEACEARGLESTGHYWDHEWPHCLGVPDNMAMAAWQHRPGIDTLMNQYSETTHAQFGNVRFCREIASVANQLGRERTLVEVYGAGGWDLRFEDMKRIADWLLVLGVNTLDEHLSYVTLRGARKRDHPQSFSYHEPWWKAYHSHALPVARLSAALSQGRRTPRILVLEPTSTAWMYQGNEARLKELGDSFFRVLMSLEAAQVEYDLGCEDVMARLGGIGSAVSIPGAWTASTTLKVGRADYSLVVIPPLTENLNRRTRTLLHDYVTAGGVLVSVGPVPGRTDGVVDPEAEGGVTVRRRWKVITEDELVPALRVLQEGADVVVTRAPGDPGNLFHHRRELDGGQLLFLVNTSLEHVSRGTVRARAGSLERWDPETGATAEIEYRPTVSGWEASFELPPAGSALWLLSDVRKDPPKVDPPERAVAIPATGDVDVERVALNVLTLDYVDVTAGGESLKDAYFYPAQEFVWKRNGLDRSPWDNAVQVGDESIRRGFPARSGFVADYRFEVEGAIPEDLEIVVERPDLYSITCNGRPVKPADGWWLDKAFGRVPLAKEARAGGNVVRLEASPFTMFHELEPAYLRGTFRLRSAERGWVVVADAPLGVGSGLGWNAQGHPFYAEGVTYRRTFRVSDRDGRFAVQLPSWYGAVAEVEVNGKPAGWIRSAPWECDVTRFVRRGDNVVAVTVIGTLKNTLGPHHGNPPLGSAWPGMFQRGSRTGPPPGDAYHTVGYGLFEPMTLTRRVSR
ncbi:MAG: glycosyl hydrolase [Limisphaerales bacterium]